MSIQISNFAENLFNMNWIINYISKSIAPVGQVKELKQLNEITDELLNGSCILFVDQNTTALSLSVEGWN